MGQNYYYLVAGLPDIILDDGKLSVSFDGLMHELSEQVDASDRELLKLLLLPFDNKNLIGVIDKRETAFDSRGFFSREELSDGVKNPDVLPEYMQEYVVSVSQGKELFPGLAKEDQLTWLFYEDVTRHGNSFIAEWFSFERDLRNVIAGINYRKQLGHIEALGSEREKPVSAIVLGRNEVADAVLRSSAPDFGIGNSVPWIEQVLAASKGTLVEFEKAIDTLRWNVLNDLTCFSYFSIETILAFVIKLLMVERWKNLDPEVGKDRLDLLVNELCSGFTVPKGF
jgi:hypothetical protein